LRVSKTAIVTDSEALKVGFARFQELENCSTSPNPIFNSLKIGKMAIFQHAQFTKSDFT